MDGPTDDQRADRPDLAILDQIGSSTIVTITISHLAGLDTAKELMELLTSVRANGTTNHFILDMQNVASIDSSCIGVLVDVLTQMQAAGADGGRIALVNAAQHVEHLFRLTSLDRVFPICRDVMAALQAVEGSAAA